MGTNNLISTKPRCGWAHPENKAMCEYHDSEWGVPVHDDRKLFEMLILEGAQAGLSWNTVLQKRAQYREAFYNFDPVKVAAISTEEEFRLLQNPGIIRNRLKVHAAVRNAIVFLKIQEEFGSFDRFIWNYTDYKPVNNTYSELSAVPVKTMLSDRIAKDLKKRGMNFVGSTIIYSYMQAIGMVNDHVTGCFRHGEILQT